MGIIKTNLLRGYQFGAGLAVDEHSSGPKPDPSAESIGPGAPEKPHAFTRGEPAVVEDTGAPHDEFMRELFFSVLRRRAGLIACAVIATVAISMLIILLSRPRYTATAIIQIDLSDKSAGKSGPTAVVDAGAIVENHALLLESPILARRVAQRLGLDDPQHKSQSDLATSFVRIKLVGPDIAAQATSLLRKLVGPDITAQTTSLLRQLVARGSGSPSQLDRAAQALMRNLKVEREPRSYLLTVAYTGASPREAAQIANAFVDEYLRVRLLTELSDRQSAEQQALTDLQATYGPKHPRVKRAEARLALAASAQARAVAEDGIDALKLDSGGRVMRAQEVTIPVGPRARAILGLAALLGPLLGIGLALVLERRALLGAMHRISRDAPSAQPSAASSSKFSVTVSSAE